MHERRAAARYKLPLLMAIKRGLPPEQFDVLYGRLHDISTTGVYFTCQEHFTVGDKLDFSLSLSLSLPMEDTGDAEVSIEAQARVVRVEVKHQTGSQRVGVAVVIERYETIRSKAPNTV